MNDKQIIKRLTQELEETTKPKWVSVNDIEPTRTDCLYWVYFPTGEIVICRLNDYKKYGGIANYWQDLGSNDLSMHETMYWKVNKPEPPQQ